MQTTEKGIQVSNYTDRSDGRSDKHGRHCGPRQTSKMRETDSRARSKQDQDQTDLQTAFADRQTILQTDLQTDLQTFQINSQTISQRYVQN